MADETILINTGTPSAPYQQFEVSLAAGEVRKIDYVTENFALLETTTANVLRVNFGGSASETNFMTGIQYKLTRAVPYVTLINSSASPLTVKFALGCGEIKDNRLSVSGTVQTTETYTLMTVASHTFDSTGVVAITSPARKWIIQNTGAAPVYVGASNGLAIQPSGSMTLPLDANFDIYGTNGETVVTAAFE